jgi:predicted pyridoxine 5'-phosphate oxidase superfamily flavin-nucleotide-binding protein
MDNATIGFADYRGNRQYVSTGNVLVNDRVALILVDYPQRLRLKILGRARIVSVDQADILSRLRTPGYRARVERGFLIDVVAFDWNCPQHITPRYSRSELAPTIGALQARIAELEEQLKKAAQPQAGVGG